MARALPRSYRHPAPSSRPLTTGHFPKRCLAAPSPYSIRIDESRSRPNQPGRRRLRRQRREDPRLRRGSGAATLRCALGFVPMGYSSGRVARAQPGVSAPPLETSAIASTSWPASRKATITGPAQLSSARNFTLQRLVLTGRSDSNTTSSWATLAAP